MGDINWEGLMDEIGSDIPLSIAIEHGSSSPFSDINWEGLSDAVGSYIPFQNVFNLSDYLGDDWLKDIDLGTKGLDLSPAAEKILFENLPYISDNFYGDDVVIPGQLGGFNPDAPPIGFNLGQDPGVWLDYYGYGAGDFMPDYFKDKEPVGGAHTTVDAVLGPSGRPQINTTPGGGSTANTSTGGPGAPGTPSGTSVREPSTTNTSTTTTGGTKTTGTTGTTTGKGLSIGGVLGGLAAMGLLGKVLGLFDSSGSSDKYTGIKIPKVTDITKPDTPQIAPVRVVPVPVQAPVVSQDIKTALAKNLGSTELAHGGLARAAMPYMLARGGRLDFRHGAPVRGEGTGQSDDIPALLSDGEFVFPADVVAALGDGSNKAGADKLYELMHSVRERARSTDSKSLPPKAKAPLQYMKGVK
jgi:hypothetical protein